VAGWWCSAGARGGWEVTGSRSAAAAGNRA